MAEEDVQEVQLPEELFSSKEDGVLCGVEMDAEKGKKQKT
jgi:hypothetical protein